MKIWKYKNIKYENMIILKYEHIKIQKCENMKIWKYDNIKVWKYENIKIWKYGNMKICDNINIRKYRFGSVVIKNIQLYLYLKNVYVVLYFIS